MDIKTTKLCLKTLPNTTSVLLKAKHGVGKSNSVKQVAEEMGWGFYDVRLSQCEVGDIKGLPYREGETMKFAKPEWFPTDENSKGIYQGKIFVDSKAQKTNGYQLSKAILLNENAEFDAKPELEIYADDVKCSHGSTSGCLDENSIFYLMSRGIKRKDAEKLLISGFILDAVEKITELEIKKLIKEIMGIIE